MKSPWSAARDAVELFFEKRVQIEGDLMYAAQMAALFRVPRCRRRSSPPQG